MKKRNRPVKSEVNKNEPGIKIDYKNLDVTDIMSQIKKKIALEKEKGETIEPGPMTPEPAPAGPFPEPPEIQGLKGKAKKILLKIMRPFSPLIKLLILPVHEEYMETARNLHWAHIRLDNLDVRLDAALRIQSDALDNVNIRMDNLSDQISNMGEELKEISKSINKRIDKVSSNTHKRIDLISQTVNERIDKVSDDTNKRIELLYKNSGRAAEYIKLLHNLSHNLVIEMTKLKIEEEHLKLKTRIMEKDFEFVSRKEKALEEKIFQ
jgi:hypothetical protein